jgi:hypothetical protein
MTDETRQNQLTYSERLLLYCLVDEGPRFDDDTPEDRVLVNSGLAERFNDPITGHGMIRVTAAGKLRANGCSQ